jgi:hypothetical protein
MAINMEALSKMSADELRALVAQMAAQPARKLTLKVTEKGGLSVYGLGRFPTTLYASQWERLLAPETVKEINAFITANAKLLARKD